MRGEQGYLDQGRYGCLYSIPRSRSQRTQYVSVSLDVVSCIQTLASFKISMLQNGLYLGFT